MTELPPENYPPSEAFPPQGSYPPPPAGNFPPAAPGFSPTGAPPFSVGDGFSWAWGQFTKNAWPLIFATVVYSLIEGALYILNQLALAATYTGGTTVAESSDGSVGLPVQTSTATPATLGVYVVGGIVHLLFVGVVGSAWLGGLLDVANGQRVTVGSFFKPRRVGPVVLAALIIHVLTIAGTFLCIIPGLLVVIFTVFSIVALLDRNLSAIDGIKASFAIVKENFGSVLLVLLVSFLTIVAGALLLLVGLLAAFPVVALFHVYAYRRLGGGEVAPVPV